MILQQLFENSDQVIYYLAYGMLTDPDVMQGLDMVGAGVLRDYQFEFAQFANVYPEPGAQVYGTLWAIDSAVLSELDEIEGYPEFYTRDRVQVSCQGRKYTAQVYTMTAGAREDLQGSAPSSHYLARLARGYSHAGLPQRQIQQALQALTESASVGATAAGSVAVMAQPLGELQTRTSVPKMTKYRNSVGLTTPRKNK